MVRTSKKKETKTTAPKKVVKEKVEKVAKEKVEKVVQVREYDEYYYVNTNKSGTVFINDLNKFVEYDPNFNKIYRFNSNECKASRDIKTQSSRNNIADITGEYSDYLEGRLNHEQLLFKIRNIINNKEEYATPSSVPAYKRMSSDKVLLSDDEISRVDSSVSDYASHMSKIKNNDRENAITESIETITMGGTSNDSFIVDENYADRSNPNSFVDPRMGKSRTPSKPHIVQMRDTPKTANTNKEDGFYVHKAENLEQSYANYMEEVNKPKISAEALKLLDDSQEN